MAAFVHVEPLALQGCPRARLNTELMVCSSGRNIGRWTSQFEHEWNTGTIIHTHTIICHLLVKSSSENRCGWCINFSSFAARLLVLLFCKLCLFDAVELLLVAFGIAFHTHSLMVCSSSRDVGLLNLAV